MEFEYSRTYPQKRRKWPVVIVTLALLFCVSGVITLVIKTTDEALPDVSATLPAAPPAKPAAKKPTPPAANAKTIGGDDIVHVGEDVPPGVYRAAAAVDGLCYWLKSKDAEGAQIIDNDIPAGGRPQVTLKKGQWFKSQGCPQWVAK